MKKIIFFYLLIIYTTLNAQINLGVGSSTLGSAPISSYYAYSYVQQIFPKQEINANSSGNITGVKFYLEPTVLLTNSADWVVYLGHTTKTNFSSNSDWIPLSTLTKVYDGTVSNVNGMVQISFSTPFLYNNTDNLVIVVEQNTPGFDTANEVFYVYPAAPNSTIVYKNDITPTNTNAPYNGLREAFKSSVTLMGLAQSTIMSCPVVTYPMNHGTFVPISPTIQWNSIAGATGYKVSIGTTPGGTDIVNEQSVSVTSFVPPTALNLNTDYYLRVTAIGQAGATSGCSEMIFKTVPPPPPNDDCGSAITLTVNSGQNCIAFTSGYTLEATDSLVPACDGASPDDDVWYKFVATDTRHKISLNNVNTIGTENSDDINFEVFGGGCNSLVSILCVDTNTNSSIISGLTVGETYYVRVYSYGGVGNNQSFDICVSNVPPPPSNDECLGALMVSSFPYTFVQSDATGATGGFTDFCPTDGMNDGTWFTFVGNGSTLDIAITLPSGSSFNPQIGIYSGSCGSLVCQSTVDMAGPGGTEMTSIPTILGTTYYVNIGETGIFDEPEGPFTIKISQHTLSTAENKVDSNLISVYPNPFKDTLTISDIKDIELISIVDISGKKVKTIQNPSSTFYVGDLVPGLYILSLYKKDGSQQKFKILKNEY